MLVYGLHLLFWSPFVVRGQFDRMAGRQQTGPAAHKASAPSGLVWLHGLALGATYFGIGLGLFGGAIYAIPNAVRLSGVLVILAGFVLVIRTLLVFRSWRLRAELAEGHELCTDGPFRTVRHPIYTALVLLCIGSFLLIPNTLTAVGIVTTWATGDLRARAEEKLLIAAFGQRYQTLMTKTKRFIPGIY